MLLHTLFRVKLCRCALQSLANVSTLSLHNQPSIVRCFVLNLQLFRILKRHQNVSFTAKRFINKSSQIKEKNKTTAHYAIAITIAFLAFSYASVPLYRIYCQATGKGGRAFIDKSETKIYQMEMNKDRKINVSFVADTNSKMSWNFKPTQNVIQVMPGETALAFFTAKNPLDKPVTGIATYSVMPYEAGLYFNKIQCFCFEEQMLNPNEEVDLPVFFYIDPEFVNDPRLEMVSDIVLSYTFFEAKKSTKWSKFLNNIFNINLNRSIQN